MSVLVRPLAVLVGFALAAQLPLARGAHAADFLVFPVKASLPIHVVLVGFATDTVVKEKLKEKDLVNLALGRSLQTKVDKKTEVLAVAVNPAAPTTPPPRLIVFDPSQGGLAGIVTEVATVAELDFETAAVKRGLQGQGILTIEIVETTLGDPAEHALHAATVLATGFGKGPPFEPPGLDLKLSLKGELAGRVSFTSTEGGNTSTVEGFIVKGKAKVSGKSIGSFSK